MAIPTILGNLDAGSERGWGRGEVTDCTSEPCWENSPLSNGKNKEVGGIQKKQKERRHTLEKS